MPKRYAKPRPALVMVNPLGKGKRKTVRKGSSLYSRRTRTGPGLLNRGR